MEGYQVDELKLYFGDDIKIADGIIIKSPTVGDIVDYGEKEYFSMAQTLTATPSSFKVQLDDMKLDWEKVSEFQLFMMLSQSLPQSATKLLLGDLDLTTLKPYSINDSDDVVLSNEDHSIVINEVIYEVMMTNLRKMHGFSKQVDKAGNAMTHRILIQVARDDAKKAQNKPYKSFLLPLVSALQGRQGYAKEYIRNMGIFEFMNQISRTQVILQADAALKGMYSGFVDTKKMDKSILDWTRDLSSENKKSNYSNQILKEGAN